MSHPDQAAALTKALVSLIGHVRCYDKVLAYMASHESELSDPTTRKRVVSGKAGDYCTPLIAACIVGDLRILQYLLAQGADPNVPRDIDGATPLHIASEFDQADLPLLNELLRAGANVNSSALSHGTPLHAAVRRKSLKHVKRLVESGAHVDATELNPTTTPLLIAAFSKQLSTASYLLAKGADPNKAQNDEDRMTPLTAAALNGDPAIVKLLLDAGADPHFVCPKGSTPLVYACNAPSAKGASVGNTLAVVRILLDHGVPINHASPLDGHTALSIAAQLNQHKLVQELIARGAHVDEEKDHSCLVERVAAAAAAAKRKPPPARRVSPEPRRPATPKVKTAIGRQQTTYLRNDTLSCPSPHLDPDTLYALLSLSLPVSK